MARVILHTAQALDHGRNPWQRPQVGPETVGVGAAAQGGIQGGQLPRVQPRFPARPPSPLQAAPALGLPGVIPPAGGHWRHGQPAGHGHLRLAAREQPRSLEPACFQRSKIPSGTTRSRHVSVWHRSP